MVRSLIDGSESIHVSTTSPELTDHINGGVCAFNQPYKYEVHRGHLPKCRDVPSALITENTNQIIYVMSPAALYTAAFELILVIPTLPSTHHCGHYQPKDIQVNWF